MNCERCGNPNLKENYRLCNECFEEWKKIISNVQFFEMKLKQFGNIQKLYNNFLLEGKNKKEVILFT